MFPMFYSVGRSRSLAFFLAVCVMTWPLLGYAQTGGGDGGWQRVEVLEGASPAQMDVFMGAMNTSLGVGCEHCHEPDAWHLESNPEKTTARTMMRMIAALSVTSFEALDVPTCWTCHRGSATPALFAPVATEDSRGYGSEVFASGREPAGQAYDNVQQYVTTPAEDLADVMESYSTALGVGCDYCHVAGNFASDEKVSKLLARRMLEIQMEVQDEFFESGPAISCWTCHRGEPVPAMSLPLTPVSIP